MIVTHMRRTTAVVFMKVFFSVQHVHAFMPALAHEVHNFPTVFLHRECFGSAEKLKLLTKHVPNNSSVNLVHPFLSLSRLLLQEHSSTTTLFARTCLFSATAPSFLRLRANLAAASLVTASVTLHRGWGRIRLGCNRRSVGGVGFGF